MPRILSFICVLLLTQSLDAQSEFIVLLCDTCDISTSLAQLNQSAENHTFRFDIAQTISARSRIYLLQQLREGHKEMEVLDFLRQQKSIKIAQQNRQIQLRNTPNDPLLPMQWQYINTGTGSGVANMDLDADLAWDIATGGNTALGDTIVVAVIDNGALTSHPDLAANVWYNRAEIPNNNIDDDQNGYVDDYRGWNVLLANDEVVANGGSHGTPVAGIIGAVGNNGLGVSGINWRVKLMIIRNNFNTSEASVLAAYEYALQARIRYNQTQGREGAFVVATNASWGLDYGQPSDAPLWCAFYDTLGQYGILNAAATANLNINVDTQGDLPTTCPSEYLVAVTNINRMGDKVNSAAYGAQNIDLGAFGEGAYTINSASSYGSFGGTSAAAPQAAGAIALVYSALCADYIHLARARPAEVAAYVRRCLLDGAKPNVFLDGITSTGGQLNLNGALQMAISDCPDKRCEAAYNLQILERSTNNLAFSWSSFSDAEAWAISYRTSPDTAFCAPIAITRDSFAMHGLAACTAVEFWLWPLCNGGQAGDSLYFLITSDGCCEAPNLVQASVSSGHTDLQWQQVAAAQGYLLEYRQAGENWQQVYCVGAGATLSGLEDCAAYEYRISTECAASFYSAPTAAGVFYTSNCTDCLRHQYCAQAGQNSEHDYINSLTINNIEITDGNSGGYIFVDTPQLRVAAGGRYHIDIVQGGTDLQYLRIWIDYNQDGDFEDAGEQAAQERFLYEPDIQVAVNVPISALYGLTRMRVALRYGAYAELCENFAFGEVQDHCLFVDAGTSAESLGENEDKYRVNLGANYARIAYLGEIKAGAAGQRLEVWNMSGQRVYAAEIIDNEELIIDLRDLPAANFVLRVATAEGWRAWKF